MLPLFILGFVWVLCSIIPLFNWMVKKREPENGLDIIQDVVVAALIVLSGPVGYLLTYKNKKKE